MVWHRSWRNISGNQKSKYISTDTNPYNASLLLIIPVPDIYTCLGLSGPNPKKYLKQIRCLSTFQTQASRPSFPMSKIQIIDALPYPDGLRIFINHIKIVRCSATINSGVAWAPRWWLPRRYMDQHIPTLLCCSLGMAWPCFLLISTSRFYCSSGQCQNHK